MTLTILYEKVSQYKKAEATAWKLNSEQIRRQSKHWRTHTHTTHTHTHTRTHAGTHARTHARTHTHTHRHRHTHTEKQQQQLSTGLFLLRALNDSGLTVAAHFDLPLWSDASCCLGTCTCSNEYHHIQAQMTTVHHGARWWSCRASFNDEENDKRDHYSILAKREPPA